jgi:hypothetical protein
MNTNRRAALESVPLKNVQAVLPDLKAFKNSAQKAMNPVEKASVIFNMAIEKAGVKPDWIAAELSRQDFRVSATLVSYWRNPDRTELPNNAHIAALGPEFERTYAKCQSKVNGWAFTALLEAMQAMGNLAEAIEA